MRLVGGRLALCGACLGVLALVGCIESGNAFVSGLALKGFEQQGPLTVYNKDNLFDYIDGEAELYFSFGFKLLYKQTYRKKKTGTLIAVDAYEMKTSRGAQGLLNKHVEEGDSFLKGLADAAYTDSFALLLRKGRYFIRVTPHTFVNDTTKTSREDLLDMGHALDRALASARK